MLFSDYWADFDPDANSTIPANKLPDLLKALPQPLGLQGAPRAWIVRVCLNFGLTMTNGELKFGDVLRTLVKFNFQQQMFDELPPESAAAQEAINAAGEDGASKGSAGQSMLWADGMTAEKKEVAQRFALELLRLSNGTREFRRVAMLPRAERLVALKEQLKQSAQSNVLRRFSTAVNGSPSNSFSSPVPTGGAKQADIDALQNQIDRLTKQLAAVEDLARAKQQPPAEAAPVKVVEAAPAPAVASTPASYVPPFAEEELGQLSYTGNALMFILEGDFDSFTAQMESEFLDKLASFGGLSPRQLVVIRKREGSIVLEIAVLHAHAAPRSAPRLVELILGASNEQLSHALGWPVRDKLLSRTPRREGAAGAPPPPSPARLIQARAQEMVQAALPPPPPVSVYSPGPSVAEAPSTSLPPVDSACQTTARLWTPAPAPSTAALDAAKKEEEEMEAAMRAAMEAAEAAAAAEEEEAAAEAARAAEAAKAEAEMEAAMRAAMEAAEAPQRPEEAAARRRRRRRLVTPMSMLYGAYSSPAVTLTQSQDSAAKVQAAFRGKKDRHEVDAKESSRGRRH